MNENYFDIINTPNKAYWLGFLWCDSYTWIRKRKNSYEYGMKLDLSSIDINHLYKLKKEINNNTEIKQYNRYKNSFQTNNGICRLSTYNKHFVLALRNEYGIIQNRYDCSKIINILPQKYYRDFIRGLLDGDGTVCFYNFCSHYKSGRIQKGIKYEIDFYGSEQILKFIEKFLYNNQILKNIEHKISKRHKDRDTNCYKLKFIGKNRVIKILDLLYKDSETYLDRKYNKFLEIKRMTNINE